MTQEHKTVFISYRRNVSAFIARAVFQDLRANGYDVFMDVENIDSGQFDTIILRQIEARAHFVVILAPGTIERCVEPDDWLRREIEHAIDTQRNIVPLLVNDFTFGGTEQYLTGKLVELPRFNGLEVPHNYFDAAMERLRTRFLKQPVYGAITPAPLADQPLVQQKIAAAVAIDVGDILPPPFEWVKIPGGVVTLEDASSFGGTKGGAYRLASFDIAKYPITNAQYQVFVDAPDGYTNPNWWDYSDHAKAWRNAYPKPQDRAFPRDDHPRANVTWYEAVAFCRWLTAKVTPLGTQRTAPLEIMLPTEQQWQRAAEGDTGWKYPWGDDFELDTL